MNDSISYPAPAKIIEYNVLALSRIKAKKADKAQVLNPARIVNVLSRCKASQGDIYAKAVCLIKGLIQEHAFASGNRRTAFITTKAFIHANGGQFRIKDKPQYARVMQGIRENYYTDNEIREWILYGRIKEFKR